jgi:uncharacterized protein YeaC (DUF1315 family)
LTELSAGISTSTEEAMLIIEKVRRYLLLSNEDSQWLPWEVIKSTDKLCKSRNAKIEAFEDELGVFPDGNMVPLTMKQKLLFGSPLNKLIYKVDKVRKKANKLIEDVESYKEWEVDFKDTILIRHFILECLCPFKRHALSLNIEAYEAFRAEKPSWSVYIISWIFISGILCFYIYWIFAWGVHNGDETIKAWGIIYGLHAGNDMVLVEVTKVLIVYYLPAQAMQPQLLRIRKVLADVSMTYINRHDPMYGAPADKNDEGSICVVQHMSAACRASRAPELRKLPASWLLRQVRAVLFAIFFIVCSTNRGRLRSNRNTCLFTLIFNILNFSRSYSYQIDDLDVEKCRQGRLDYLGVLSFFAIAIPMTLILLNDRIGDALLDSVLPSVFSGIFYVGSALYKISLATLLLPTFLSVAIVLYFLYVYRPARAAYSQREKNMRLMSDQGMAYTRSTRSHTRERKIKCKFPYLENTVNYFGRVFSILTHSLQHAVTYFSSYHIAVSRIKTFTQRKQWCDMNTPHSFQGSIPADAEMENIHFLSSSAHRYCQTIFNIPPEISNMMTSTTNWKRAYKEQAKNKKFADSLEDAGARVITRKQDAKMTVRQIKTPIFFSAEEALDVIRLNLIKNSSNKTCEVLNKRIDQFKRFADSLQHAGAQDPDMNRRQMKTLIEAINAMRLNLIKDSSDSPCDELNKYCEVPIPDLVDQFRETMNLFYPDGIEMTTEEKEESCEMLTAWKDTHNLRITTEVIGGAIIETQMVDILLFDAWFTNVFVATMSEMREERLLNYTLRYVPKVKRKVLNSWMRMPDGRSQPEMMDSNLQVKTMKVLSPVDPDELEAPYDSPQEITPVEHYGGDDEVHL